MAKVYTQQEINSGVKAAHDAMRQQTGYTGDFGGGAFNAFYKGNPGYEASVGKILQDYNAGSYAPPNLSSTALATGQAGLASTQADLSTGITGLGAGQATLGQGQAGLMSGQAGLSTGQAGLSSGISALGTGQGGLMSGQTQLAGGQTQLAENQAALSTQSGGIQSSIGQAAAGTNPATGLYAGQSGLMGNQQQIGAGLASDISGVGADLSALQRQADAYQRGAQDQRSEIQTAGITGRKQIGSQVSEVANQGAQVANTMASNQQALMSSPLVGQGVPSNVVQQAANYAQTAPSAASINQTGPMGPVAQDPRDAIIAYLLNRPGLMAPQA